MPLNQFQQDRLKHVPSMGLSLLEAVSYVAGEHPCVCPVLLAIGRVLSDRWEAAERPRLMELIPLLVGSRSSVDVAYQRSFVMAAACIRDIIPTGLEAVGWYALASALINLKDCEIEEPPHTRGVAREAFALGIMRSASAKALEYRNIADPDGPEAWRIHSPAHGDPHEIKKTRNATAALTEAITAAASAAESATYAAYAYAGSTAYRNISNHAHALAQSAFATAAFGPAESLSTDQVMQVRGPAITATLRAFVRASAVKASP